MLKQNFQGFIWYTNAFLIRFLHMLLISDMKMTFKGTHWMTSVKLPQLKAICKRPKTVLLMISCNFAFHDNAMWALPASRDLIQSYPIPSQLYSTFAKYSIQKPARHTSNPDYGYRIIQGSRHGSSSETIRSHKRQPGYQDKLAG